MDVNIVICISMERKRNTKEVGKRPARHEEDMSRRTFLKDAIAAFGVGAVGSVYGPKAWEEGWNIFGAEKLEADIRQLENELSHKYGIPIRVWSPDPEIHPASARKQATSLKDKSLYLAYKGLHSLKQALMPYPTDFIHEQVSGIELVYTLTYSGEGMGEDVVAQGVTSFGGSITLSVGRGAFLETHEAIFSDALESEVVHHELAHIFTERVQNKEWTQMHSNAIYVGAEWKQAASELPPGFAIPYGRRNVAEDMATVAELLFVDEKTMRERIQGDQILERKVQFMQGVYAQRTGGKMNDDFWQDVRAGKVTETYWE